MPECRSGLTQRSGTRPGSGARRSKHEPPPLCSRHDTVGRLVQRRVRSSHDAVAATATDVERERQCARRPLSSRGRCTRSEEHTSELQSLMRISYAVFCLKKKKKKKTNGYARTDQVHTNKNKINIHKHKENSTYNEKKH